MQSPMELVMGSQDKPRARKPYTITKQRERWSDEEHQRFLEAMRLFGRKWGKIEEYIGTKTAVQIRSHAQKFFGKLEKQKGHGDVVVEETLNLIPPPRPKRKPLHPYPKKEDAAVSPAHSAPSALGVPLASVAVTAQNLNGSGGEWNAASSMGGSDSDDARSAGMGQHKRHQVHAGCHSPTRHAQRGVTPSFVMGLTGPHIALPGQTHALQSTLLLPAPPGGGGRPNKGMGPMELSSPPLAEYPGSKQALALRPSLPIPSLGSLNPQQMLAPFKWPQFSGMDGEEQQMGVGQFDVTLAAVAAAASAAAATAAMAVVREAGEHMQSQLQSNPPSGFPFFGFPPAMLSQLTGGQGQKEAAAPPVGLDPQLVGMHQAHTLLNVLASSGFGPYLQPNVPFAQQQLLLQQQHALGALLKLPTQFPGGFAAAAQQLPCTFLAGPAALAPAALAPAAWPPAVAAAVPEPWAAASLQQQQWQQQWQQSAHSLLNSCTEGSTAGFMRPDMQALQQALAQTLAAQELQLTQGPAMGYPMASEEQQLVQPTVLALKQDGKLLLVRGTPAELALQKMLPPPCPPPSSQAAADAVGCTPMDFQAVATGMGRTFSAQKLAVSLAKPEGVLGQHAVAVLAPGSGPLSTPFFTDASLGSLGLSDPCVHADVTGNKKWLQSGVTAAGARLPRTGHSHHAPSASPGAPEPEGVNGLVASEVAWLLNHFPQTQQTGQQGPHNNGHNGNNGSGGQAALRHERVSRQHTAAQLCAGPTRMEASGADGGEDREREGSSEDCSGSQLGSDEGEAGAGQGAEQKRVKTGNSSKQTLPGCQPSGLPSSSNGLRSLLGLGRGDASPWGGTQQSGGGQGMGSAQLGSGSGAHAMESAPIDSHLIKMLMASSSGLMPHGGSASIAPLSAEGGQGNSNEQHMPRGHVAHHAQNFPNTRDVGQQGTTASPTSNHGQPTALHPLHAVPEPGAHHHHTHHRHNAKGSRDGLAALHPRGGGREGTGNTPGVGLAAANAQGLTGSASGSEDEPGGPCAGNSGNATQHGNSDSANGNSDINTTSDTPDAKHGEKPTTSKGAAWRAAAAQHHATDHSGNANTSSGNRSGSQEEGGLNADNPNGIKGSLRDSQTQCNGSSGNDVRGAALGDKAGNEMGSPAGVRSPYIWVPHSKQGYAGGNPNNASSRPPAWLGSHNNTAGGSHTAAVPGSGNGSTEHGHGAHAAKPRAQPHEANGSDGNSGAEGEGAEEGIMAGGSGRGSGSGGSSGAEGEEGAGSKRRAAGNGSGGDGSCEGSRAQPHAPHPAHAPHAGTPIAHVPHVTHGPAAVSAPMQCAPCTDTPPDAELGTGSAGRNPRAVFSSCANGGSAPAEPATDLGSCFAARAGGGGASKSGGRGSSQSDLARLESLAAAAHLLGEAGGDVAGTQAEPSALCAPSPSAKRPRSTQPRLAVFTPTAIGETATQSVGATPSSLSGGKQGLSLCRMSSLGRVGSASLNLPSMSLSLPIAPLQLPGGSILGAAPVALPAVGDLQELMGVWAQHLVGGPAAAQWALALHAQAAAAGLPAAFLASLLPGPGTAAAMMPGMQPGGWAGVVGGEQAGGAVNPGKLAPSFQMPARPMQPMHATKPAMLGVGPSLPMGVNEFQSTWAPTSLGLGFRADSDSHKPRGVRVKANAPEPQNQLPVHEDPVEALLSLSRGVLPGQASSSLPRA